MRWQREERVGESNRSGANENDSSALVRNVDKGLITKRKAMLLMRRTVRNVIRNYQETTFDKNEEGQGGVKRGVGKGGAYFLTGVALE